MSAAAMFASQFVGNEGGAHKSAIRRSFVRKLGVWGFAFFALKGTAWLLIPLIAMYFA